MLHSHVISQMPDIQYSYHKVMSWHKCLILSTHVTKSLHVMTKNSDIVYSSYTVMSRLKFLVSVLMPLIHVMSSHVTNVWYSVHMSHRNFMLIMSVIQYSSQCHVMSRITYIQYSCHTDMSCHKWLIFSNYVTSLVMWQKSDIQSSYNTVMSCHKCLIFNTNITQSCHVVSQMSDIQ